MQSELIRCSACGTSFTMDRELEKLRRSDGDEFTCPNGHLQYWPKKPTSMERRLEVLERTNKRWVDTCRDLRDEVRELQKKPCPICGEMFTSVNHHMSRMHKKEWAVERERRADQATIDAVN